MKKPFSWRFRLLSTLSCFFFFLLSAKQDGRSWSIGCRSDDVSDAIDEYKCDTRPADYTDEWENFGLDCRSLMGRPGVVKGEEGKKPIP